MPRRKPSEIASAPEPAISLELARAIAAAATPRQRRIAIRYAECLAGMIADHVLGAGVAPVERRKRWKHLVTILELDGENLPDPWRKDHRAGARPLLAAIQNIINAARETSECRATPSAYERSATTPAASSRRAFSSVSPVASVASSDFRPAC